MNWHEQSSISHYQTAVAIQHQLQAGNLAEATTGLHELIDALARSERRALKSQLIRLMAHVIKWLTQPEHRSRSWTATIRSARAEIKDIQEETPSLKDAVIRQMWEQCFELAKEQAEAEMNRNTLLTALSWDEVFTKEYRV